MTVFRAKMAKTGKQKQLWQPNMQDFFEMVLIFLLLGDEVKTLKKIVSTSRLTKKNIADLVQK